jgi:cytochrome c oxidase assembly protein Cox11
LKRDICTDRGIEISGITKRDLGLGNPSRLSRPTAKTDGTFETNAHPMTKWEYNSCKMWSDHIQVLQTQTTCIVYNVYNISCRSDGGIAVEKCFIVLF